MVPMECGNSREKTMVSKGCLILGGWDFFMDFDDVFWRLTMEIFETEEFVPTMNTRWWSIPVQDPFTSYDWMGTIWVSPGFDPKSVLNSCEMVGVAEVPVRFPAKFHLIWSFPKMYPQNYPSHSLDHVRP